MGPDGSSAPPAAVPVFRDPEAALSALGRSLVAVVQPTGRIVRVQPSCAAIVGLSPARLHGRPLTGLVPVEQRRALRRAIDEAVRTGRCTRLEHDLLWAGGKRRCLSRLTPFAAAGERLVHVECTDVAPLAAARDLYEGQAALLGAMVAHVDDAIAGLSAGGAILAVSDRACALLGAARGDLLGRPIAEVLGAPVELPDDDGPSVVDVDAAAPDGARRCLRLRFRRVTARDDAIYTLVLEPAREEETAYRRLVRLASTDPLTGVRNRADLLTELSRWIAADPDRRFYVGYLDLDDFKAVNDTRGHGAGDAVLAAVGRALLRAVRSGDLVGRIGGDEFVVALRNVPSEGDARLLGTRLLAALAEVEAAGRPVRASLGLARFPDDGRTAEALLDRADGAMYAAKRLGGGAVVGTWEPAAAGGLRSASRSLA